MRRVAALLIASLLAISGCGSGGGSPSGPGSTLTVTLPSTTVASGTSTQAAATVADQSGAGTPANNVVWSTSDQTIATVSSTGLVTGVLIGSAVITATSAGMTAHATVKVVPGTASRVVVYSGNSQTGATGATLPDPLCTNVVDAAGNLIIGAAVTYVVASGGGHLAEPTAPTTQPGGIATSGLWTLGSVVGAQTVTASSGGASVTFSATAH
ncbi:MAG: Ig domain-containing protein [Gemmatimonadaceae bacterium]